ncbi:MAG: hypothetical protein KDE27_24100, partial [Planctomycetes bacterium]|nr:hypothetical protein [Planctomycetota bacterium]
SEVPTEQLVAELAVRSVGCVRCHAVDLPGFDAARVQPLPGPALAATTGWFAGAGAADYLLRHHGGDDAADLAAWLATSAPAGELAPAAASAALLARGEQLFAELACGACHAPDGFAGLAARTDHAHVAAFLVEPGTHRPAAVHDFGLTPSEGAALAAWLLRAQADGDPAPLPGFAYECFELEIENGDVPDLSASEAVATGVVQAIDVEPATRANHFALRFRATLDVPTAGDWEFVLGSDDGSWLWLDGALVVGNPGIKPYGEERAGIRLDAGPHALEVVFTQAAGGKRLELRWRGPGVETQQIPATRANARTLVLTPPAVDRPAPDAAAVARGRAAAVARRCTACHEVVDPALDALPPPAPAKAWSALRADTACPVEPAAAGVHGPATVALAAPRDDRAELARMLLQDRCTACHVRGDRGGLPVAVRQRLVETEDLGDEGLLPPDLTRVGARLRQTWIERVLREGHRVRPYLRVRMPRIDAERAARYAELFACVDGAGVEDDEPEFSVAAVETGRRLAGTNGRGCITCHGFAGAPSLGPHGMDLAIQHERVRPAWFRDWLLHAPTLRPGTRMPSFWPNADAAAIAEVSALRTWLALGRAAPVPDGLAPAAGSLVLLPSERPILHGAFLDGLSARCIAVGTSQRVHWAFDVAHARLAWLWRGDFLDATGTWHGRAGKLLKPLGEDHVVLDDLAIAGERLVAGQRISSDGYPTFVVRVGDAEYEDEVRPRLTAAGGEVVRTLRCSRGSLAIGWPTQADVELTVGGAKAPARTVLDAGQSVEVVYRW